MIIILLYVLPIIINMLFLYLSYKTRLDFNRKSNFIQYVDDYFPGVTFITFLPFANIFITTIFLSMFLILKIKS